MYIVICTWTPRLGFIYVNVAAILKRNRSVVILLKKHFNPLHFKTNFIHYIIERFVVTVVKYIFSKCFILWGTGGGPVPLGR